MPYLRKVGKASNTPDLWKGSPYAQTSRPTSAREIFAGIGTVTKGENGLKKYSVAIKVNATMYVEVEADSEEEAREKAWSEAYEPSLCHQCSDEMEIDGLGEIVGIDEVGS